MVHVPIRTFFTYYCKNQLELKRNFIIIIENNAKYSVAYIPIPHNK